MQKYPRNILCGGGKRRTVMQSMADVLQEAEVYLLLNVTEGVTCLLV